MVEQHKRYFILTPGRTGSSLLCAILADAGADFGMPTPDGWDRGGGAMEDRTAMRARSVAWKLAQPGIARPFGPATPLDRLWRFGYRRRLDSLMRRLLARTAYVKVLDAWRLVPHAARLGYAPRIILSTRAFDDWAISAGTRDVGANFDELRERYRATLENGLYFMNLHGGCVVDYDDFSHDSWIADVAAATGLEPSDIAAARKRRFRTVPPQERTMFLRDSGMDALYGRLRAADGVTRAYA